MTFDLAFVTLQKCRSVDCVQKAVTFTYVNTISFVVTVVTSYQIAVLMVF